VHPIRRETAGDSEPAVPEVEPTAPEIEPVLPEVELTDPETNPPSPQVPAVTDPPIMPIEDNPSEHQTLQAPGVSESQAVETRSPEGSSVTQAGWYEDPWGMTPLRWWDGSAWTGYVNTGQPPARS